MNEFINLSMHIYDRALSANEICSLTEADRPIFKSKRVVKEFHKMQRCIGVKYVRFLLFETGHRPLKCTGRLEHLLYVRNPRDNKLNYFLQIDNFRTGHAFQRTKSVPLKNVRFLRAHEFRTNIAGNSILCSVFANHFVFKDDFRYRPTRLSKFSFIE